MNDVEDRLRHALRDAVAEPDVPDGLLPAAARHASRIRRRRVATRGATGAVAVVAGGTLLARTHETPAAPGTRLTPTASAPVTAASATKTSGIRLWYTTDCPPTEVFRYTRENGFDCLTTHVEVARSDGTTDSTWTDWGFPPDNSPEEVVPTMTMTYADGRTIRATARPDGPDAWFFDVTVPPYRELRNITVFARGDQELGILTTER